MRPRTFARPVHAGALCLAISSAAAAPVAHAAPARATAPSTPAAAATSTGTGVLSTARRPRIRVRTRRLHVSTGARATVLGRVAPGVAGIRVRLQIRRGARWVTIDRARTRERGRYALRDRVARTLSARVRVKVSRGAGVRAGARVLGRLNVYRHANASWYGPGFYGNRTGCGGRLASGQLGVAHKSLPCGTKVTFRHRGRTVRVPVIDRGPYVGGRDYDLTAATAARLGFHGHGRILATR